MTTFAELRAWVNSDAGAPADSDGDVVQAHNGLRFCRCDDGGIWLEDEQTDGRPVTLAEAKALITGGNEMTPETISKDFDQDILPRWARNDSQVVEACRHSLSFRADVFRASTPGMKRLLRRTAGNYIPQSARCASCGRGVEVEGGAYTYGFDGTAPVLCADCSR